MIFNGPDRIMLNKIYAAKYSNWRVYLNSLIYLYFMFLLSVCYRFAMWGRYVIVRLDIEQAPGILGYLNT